MEKEKNEKFGMRLILLSISIMCVFNSCSSNIVFNDLVDVNKNLTFNKAKQIYKDYFDFDRNLIERNIEGDNFKVIYFNINVEIKEEYNIFYNTIYSFFPSFLLLFKNDKYYFAGYIYEFELKGNEKVKSVLKNIFDSDDNKF